MFTTSYKSVGMEELITALVKTTKAKLTVEFGTQQGHSAILLARGSKKVITFDLFEEKYLNAPYKETHAEMLTALQNVKGFNVEIRVENVNKVKPFACDVLHIDICNHKDNVYPLLKKWQGKVKKMILLEGGVYNKWQKKYNFKPFIPALFGDIFVDWDYTTVKGDNGYALTILTRRIK